MDMQIWILERIQSKKVKLDEAEGNPKHLSCLYWVFRRQNRDLYTEVSSLNRKIVKSWLTVTKREPMNSVLFGVNEMRKLK